MLTQGTHVGIAKLIGSAVKDYIAETGSGKLDDIVLLGIVSYGSITGREALRFKDKKNKNQADASVSGSFMSQKHYSVSLFNVILNQLSCSYLQK